MNSHICLILQPRAISGILFLNTNDISIQEVKVSKSQSKVMNGGQGYDTNVKLFSNSIVLAILASWNQVILPYSRSAPHPIETICLT